MAKRARGSTSRPGQRARLQRSGPRPSSSAGATTPARAADAANAPKPPTLTPEEEARAAELEARILAEERAAEAAEQQSRARSRRESTEAVAGRSGSLAVRASEEYGYVVRDVRRIAVIGTILIAIMLGLWVATQTTGFSLS